MRTLQANELTAAYGGGVWEEVLKIIGGEIVIGAMKSWYNENVGVAGPRASEMDNGGTSYGIGICNTFGCNANDWLSSELESGEFEEYSSYA